MGMEWAYRLASDPKRLAGRYLKTNPIFISMAMKELLKSKHFSL
jgi:N-acetylglucosaminyldiphosphoundecaprenol N-acetyl-beta-D-mannosaminyltransferase